MYRLGWSFRTENHTLQSLAKHLTNGYPVTMVHHKIKIRRPNVYRQPSTPRVTENFISMQMIFLDDDRAQPGVIDEWMNDEFFLNYGAFLYESASSQPEAEKARAAFLIDKPIKDGDLFKEIQKALMYRYPFVDQSTHDITRVWYGSENAPIYLSRLGNILPFEILENEILTPYREFQRKQQEKRKVFPINPPAQNSDFLERSAQI